MAGIGGALGSSLHMGQALRRVHEPRPAWEVVPAQGPSRLKAIPRCGCSGRSPCARAKSIRGWQDLCAVHDLRASDGENAPWRQDVRAVCSPTALCGAFRIHATHILPKLAVFEYMQAICCREPVFFPSGAPSGTHRGGILPRPAAWERIRAQSCHGRQLGMHQSDILPWPGAG